MAAPAITRRDRHLILICQQGFQSRLAAATLQRLGLAHATDLDGGFDAWAAAGLPVTPGRSQPLRRDRALVPNEDHVKGDRMPAPRAMRLWFSVFLVAANWDGPR